MAAARLPLILSRGRKAPTLKLTAVNFSPS